MCGWYRHCGRHYHGQNGNNPLDNNPHDEWRCYTKMGVRLNDDRCCKVMLLMSIAFCLTVSSLTHWHDTLWLLDRLAWLVGWLFRSLFTVFTSFIQLPCTQRGYRQTNGDDGAGKRTRLCTHTNTIYMMVEIWWHTGTLNIKCKHTIHTIPKKNVTNKDTTNFKLNLISCRVQCLCRLQLWFDCRLHLLQFAPNARNAKRNECDGVRLSDGSWRFWCMYTILEREKCRGHRVIMS